MSEPAGPSPQMGAVDHLMHRGEANPRTRSGVMLVEILDRTPDWTRLLDTFERASRVVPRLRQKAVVPSLPTASPRWVIDPDFDLLYHLRRVRAPEPGDLRTVLDMAEVIVSSPLDVGRPLWTVTLVEDLADGQSALLSHFSHAVTDGVGGVEMFMHLYDNERNPALEPMPPLPVPEDLTPTDLTRSGIYHLPQNLIGGVVGAVTGATPHRRQPGPGPDLDRRRRRRLRPLEHPRDGHAGRAVPTAAAPRSVAPHRGARHPAGPTACRREGR